MYFEEILPFVCEFRGFFAFLHLVTDEKHFHVNDIESERTTNLRYSELPNAPLRQQTCIPNPRITSFYLLRKKW